MNGRDGETAGSHPRVPRARCAETALHIKIAPRLPVIAALQAPRRGITFCGIIAGCPVVVRDGLGRREINPQPDTRLILRAARRFAAEIQPLAPHRRVRGHDAIDRFLRHFSRRERTDVFIRADAAGRVVGDADPIRRDIHPFVEKCDLGKLHGIGCARILDPLNLEPIEREAIRRCKHDRAVRNRQIRGRSLSGGERQRAGPVFFERDRSAEPRALPRVIRAIRQHAQRRGAVGTEHTSRADQPVHDIALAVEIQHRVRLKSDMSRARSVRQPVVFAQAQHPRRDLGVAGIAELIGRQGQPATPQFSQPALAGKDQRAGRIRHRHLISLCIEIDRPASLGLQAQCAKRLFRLDELSVVLSRTQQASFEKHFCDGIIILIDGRYFSDSTFLQRQHTRFHGTDTAVRRPPRVEPELAAAQHRVADGDAGLWTQRRVVIGIAGDAQVAVDDELPAGDQQRAGSAVRAHIRFAVQCHGAGRLRHAAGISCAAADLDASGRNGRAIRRKPAETVHAHIKTGNDCKPSARQCQCGRCAGIRIGERERAILAVAAIGDEQAPGIGCGEGAAAQHVKRPAALNLQSRRFQSRVGQVERAAQPQQPEGIARATGRMRNGVTERDRAGDRAGQTVVIIQRV